MKNFMKSLRVLLVGILCLGVVAANVSAYILSGYVRVNASTTPISGVTINLSGSGTDTTTTGLGGDYDFTVGAGNYVITPVSASYSFSPSSRAVSVSADMFNQNFSGTPVSVDTSSPTAPGVVRDGTGSSDINSTTSTSQLSANWTASADAESGISGYLYAIGTTAGGTNTAAWTALGNILTVTRNALSLSVGSTYYFSVKSLNGTGLTSAAANSNGVVVVSTTDVTPPTTPGAVRDGTGTDISSTYSTGTLSANWDASSDPQSGIASYYYAIGTAPGAVNIIGWTNNGTNLSVTKVGLSLTYGSTYYFSVKAQNMIGLESAVTNSNGQYAAQINVGDTTPPTNIAAVRDGTGADESATTLTTQLSANWDVAVDNESGVSAYYYAIGTTPGAVNIIGWTSNVDNRSVTCTGLSLVYGSTYYFSVKAQNGASLQNSVTTSNGQVVLPAPADVTPPVISSLSAGSLTATSANITWTTDEAATSRVEYGLTASYGFLTTLDASLVTSHSVSLAGLVVGTQYHYRVISQDASANIVTSADATFTTSASTSVTTYTISGNVRDSNVNGISGVTVTLSGSASASVVTASDGSYSFDVTAGGNYTVTPSYGDYKFAPASRSYSNVTSNQAYQHFNGNPQLPFEIKGEIKVVNPKIDPEKGEKSRISYMIGNSRTPDTTKTEHVTIKIYNVNGEFIKTVVDENLPYGGHEALWNGRNFSDEVASSGVYLVRIEAGEFKATKKIVVIK
ncbi:MAG: hypothetical protein A2297_03000 [Elusimicrobia bacterium RIFOXYB2_FULL_48_7]|nr:MAG: hypothetical protein A2297_03000 [Elusimicrobia bacterium RIFOXYB2_FULL_48_7]